MMNVSSLANFNKPNNKGINMSQRQLKELLADAYKLESELVDLTKSLMKELWGEETCTTYMLDEDIADGMNYNGCLQSIDYYITHAEEQKKRLENQTTME